MAKSVVIDDTIADVLRRATVNGDTLTLPPEQLDRGTYVAVNKALEALGGKWNRKARAHIFDGPVSDHLAAVLDAGEVTVDKMGYFPTPAPLVARLLDLAKVEPHHRVLEPSAGQGAIADALLAIVPPERLHLVEIQPRNCDALRAKGYAPVEDDFMLVDIPSVDRVVMNPPFERKQDVDHVMRAFSALRPGGRLVSVMSAGVKANTDRKTADFRDLLDEQGWYETNPVGSFKDSGTGVHTVTVVLDVA